MTSIKQTIQNSSVCDKKNINSQGIELHVIRDTKTPSHGSRYVLFCKETFLWIHNLHSCHRFL